MALSEVTMPPARPEWTAMELQRIVNLFLQRRHVIGGLTARDLSCLLDDYKRLKEAECICLDGEAREEGERTLFEQETQSAIRDLIAILLLLTNDSSRLKDISPGFTKANLQATVSLQDLSKYYSCAGPSKQPYRG